MRLFEVLLHGGPQVGGWTARQIHHAVLATFDLSEKTYGLNQLRYDLRKLKGHGLIERDGTVTLPCRERARVSAPQELSGRCDRGPPRGHRRSAKRTARLG